MCRNDLISREYILGLISAINGYGCLKGKGVLWKLVVLQCVYICIYTQHKQHLTHTHTHTHINKYIYIYIYRRRGQIIF